MTARQPVCADCTAVLVDSHLTHDSTCPVGVAEDERLAADRRYFEDHPGAQSFVRQITQSEITELRLVGRIPPGWSAAGTIEVVQIRPGVRLRRFKDAWLHPMGGAA
jgi:hypothetical protein